MEYLSILIMGTALTQVKADGKPYETKRAVDLPAIPVPTERLTYCWNFTQEVGQHEFLSPSYPGDYLSHTDCIQTLKAPAGYGIHLDFRDAFHIEDSDNCEYDFLEIRDGPFGYSSLIGRYCGTNHPPMIDSTTQYLWIRFKTDDSIEYRGFRAVYEYTHKNSPGASALTACKLDVDVGKLETRITARDVRNALKTMNHKHSDKIDCTFSIHASTGSRVFLSWDDYNIEDTENCSFNFIDIYEGTTAKSGLIKQLCGVIAKPYRSNHHVVYLRVFALNISRLPHFDALVTFFKQGLCGDTGGFNCDEDSCIDESLVCNGRANCNYEWDEVNCDMSDKPGAKPPHDRGKAIMKRNHMIILSVVGTVLIGIICISLGITCKQHRSEKLRRQTALRQDERQAIETEMATLLNGSPRSGHLRSHPSQPGASAQARQTPNGTVPSGALNSSYYLNPHIGQRLNHEGDPPSMQYRDVIDTKAQVYKDATVSNGYCTNAYENGGNCSNNRGSYTKLALQSTTPKLNHRTSPRPDVVQETCSSSKGIGKSRLKDGYDNSMEHLQTRPVNKSKQIPALPFKRSVPAAYEEIDVRRHPSTYHNHRIATDRKSADDLASHSKPPIPQNYGYNVPKTPPNTSTHFDFPLSPSKGSSSYQTMPIKRQRSLGSYIDSYYQPSELNIRGSRDNTGNSSSQIPPPVNVKSKYANRKSMSVDEVEGRPQRTLSMDTKRAPILPSLRTTTQVQAQREASPDMFYTRPRKNEVRHALV